MDIKKDLEKREEIELSKYATLSEKSLGRVNPLSFELKYQTDFLYDKTKILESKAFRRLRNKTQVFLNPTNDHYRTRMTHTLEVADIAKNISNALRLNVDLTEAIALAHDIGHAPFGHIGEEALNEVCRHGFSHESQGRRIVETLEDGGLNLTLEVRDGIENHDFSKNAMTMEGQVVKFADKIAYISHDIEDAFSAKILTKSNFPNEYNEIFGETLDERKSTLIISVIKASHNKDKISMLPEHLKAFKELREFMFQKVYLSKEIRDKELLVKEKIKRLFNYYAENQSEIPEKYTDGDNHRKACDYVSGMTDDFAISHYDEIFKDNKSLKNFFE